MPGGNVAGQFHDSIHGRALAGAARGSAPTCTNCHGAHSIRPKSDPGEPAPTARRFPTPAAPATRRQRDAVRARASTASCARTATSARPGCTDCHSAHRIQPHDLPRFKTEVIKECGNCHAELPRHLPRHVPRPGDGARLRARRDLRLAATARTTCCPASDPASMVSPQNRLATCQKCHAGASANFALYDPHANRHDRDAQPALLLLGTLHGVAAGRRVHLLRAAHRCSGSTGRCASAPRARRGRRRRGERLMRYFRRFTPPSASCTCS